MMPSLPAKTIGKGNTDQAFIDKRREQLQDYLFRMSFVPGVLQSRTFGQVREIGLLICAADCLHE
jgi:hypothetical protein